jgi:hypothetical protein
LLVTRVLLISRPACVLVAVTLLVGGCTSMHHITRPPAAPPGGAWHVDAGDRVRLTMRDGQRHDATVQSVDENVVVTSDGTRYDVRQIQAIERRAFSKTRTAFLVGGLAVGTLLIIVAVAEAALLGGLQ